MQNTDTDVSLLIPAYKPEWFEQCLRSCLAQTLPAREIIISDDCPTDDIRRIVEPHLADPRLRYVRNTPSLGLAANYLQLARLASCRWLKFFDDDDILHPEGLERLMRRTDAGVSLVLGGCRMLKENGAVLEKQEPLPPRTQGMDYFLRTYTKVPLTLFSRMLIRADVAKALLADDIPPRMISLDELMGLRAALAGDVAWEPAIICDHRDFSGGYSRNREPQVLMDDLAFVTNPHDHALKEQLAPPAALRRWRSAMVRKYARGAISKFIKHKDRQGLRTFLRHLYARFGLLAVRCALSPRLLVKYGKSLLPYQ